MKTIVICNTYSQLLVSIQMRRTILKNDYVTIILSDHTYGCKDVYEHVRDSGLFDEAIYVKTKELDLSSHGFRDATKNIFSMVFGSKKLLNGIKNREYDNLLFYNIAVSSMIFYAYLSKYNKEILCERIEEGILSYGELEKPLKIPTSRGKVAYWIRKILVKNNLIECVRNVYCYYPEFYKGHLKPIEIPRISNKDIELKRLVASIFSYEPVTYKQKYIYFSSVYDFEGGRPIGELDLIERIAERVGKDNLIIKVHPRDQVERFEKIGCEIDSNSDIPWEVIQLNNEFTNHTFLTYNSSCVLTMNLCVDKPVNSKFLFNLCDYRQNEKAHESVIFIRKVLNRLASSNVEWLRIANDISEL